MYLQPLFSFNINRLSRRPIVTDDRQTDGRAMT